jgi:hypothetical protein
LTKNYANKISVPYFIILRVLSKISCREKKLRGKENHAVYAHEIPHINEFHPDHVAATWYKHEEYAAMATESAGLIFLFLINLSPLVENNMVTARGLKCMMPDK